MAVYAVESEPFDSTDGDWPSTSICMSYNDKPLEVQVIFTGDEADSEEGQAASVGLAEFIFEKMLGSGF